MYKIRRRGVVDVLFLVLFFVAVSDGIGPGGFDSVLNAAGALHAQDAGERGAPLGGPGGAVLAQHAMEFESDSDVEFDFDATIGEAPPRFRQGSLQLSTLGGRQFSATAPATDRSRAPPHA